MTSTFTRAPGEAPGSFAIECMMDDLAYQLGIDPIEIRLRNYAEKDPSTGQAWSSKGLRECYARGAELFGWSKRNPKAGVTREGRTLVGWGMATASYPVHNSSGTARVRLYADGHAVVQSGATDLGTGTYTVMTQVAADSLGLPPEKIRFELGDTKLPTAPNSGRLGGGWHGVIVRLHGGAGRVGPANQSGHQRPQISTFQGQARRSGDRKRPSSAKE